MFVMQATHGRTERLGEGAGTTRDTEHGRRENTGESGNDSLTSQGPAKADQARHLALPCCYHGELEREWLDA